MFCSSSLLLIYSVKVFMFFDLIGHLKVSCGILFMCCMSVAVAFMTFSVMSLDLRCTSVFVIWDCVSLVFVLKILYPNLLSYMMLFGVEEEMLNFILEIFRNMVSIRFIIESGTTEVWSLYSIVGIMTALIVYLINGPGIFFVLVRVIMSFSHFSVCSIVSLWLPSRVMYVPSMRKVSLGPFLSVIVSVPMCTLFSFSWFSWLEMMELLFAFICMLNMDRYEWIMFSCCCSCSKLFARGIRSSA